MANNNSSYLLLYRIYIYIELESTKRSKYHASNFQLPTSNFRIKFIFCRCSYSSCKLSIVRSSRLFVHFLLTLYCLSVSQSIVWFVCSDRVQICGWGNLPWPIKISDELRQNEWFKTLPEREQEACAVQFTFKHYLRFEKLEMLHYFI